MEIFSPCCFISIRDFTVIRWYCFLAVDMFRGLATQRYVFYHGISQVVVVSRPDYWANSITFGESNSILMRYPVFLFCVLVFFTGHSQSQAREEVKAAIDHFFEGFHQRDTSAMRAVLHDEVFMQRIGRDGSGAPELVKESIDDFLTGMANLPDTLQIRERLLDYRIQTDGNMAHAWTPYEFYLQGEFHHCGVNSFQLFRDPEGWKIIYLIDTRRVEDCDPEE